jgi:hypothetical protein
MRLFSLSMIICCVGVGESLMSEPFWVSITSNLEKVSNSVELSELNGISSKHFWQQKGSSIFFWCILYSLLVILLHLLWLHKLQYGHNNAGWSVTILLHILHGPSSASCGGMLNVGNQIGVKTKTKFTSQKHEGS